MVRSGNKGHSPLSGIGKYVVDLSVSEYVTSAKYGSILGGDLYRNTIKKAPDQDTWKLLFKDELSKRGGQISKPGLQEKAAEVLMSAVVNSKLLYVLDDVGVKKDILDKYSGKKVSQLPEEYQSKIVDGYREAVADTLAIEALRNRRAKFSKGLERVFCTEETPKSRPAASTVAPTAAPKRKKAAKKRSKRKVRSAAKKKK